MTLPPVKFPNADLLPTKGQSPRSEPHSNALTSPSVRTSSPDVVEIGWFAPLCSDDFDYLGVPDARYKSSYENTAGIARTADSLGFNNMLCPSSYQVGQDTLSFAAALAPQLRQMSLLTAVRCGELHPPMLARTLATLDHMLAGHLTVNIISSDLPGETIDSRARYQKSREVIEILKQSWTSSQILQCRKWKCLLRTFLCLWSPIKLKFRCCAKSLFTMAL